MAAIIRRWFFAGTMGTIYLIQCSLAVAQSEVDVATPVVFALVGDTAISRIVNPTEIEKEAIGKLEREWREAALDKLKSAQTRRDRNAVYDSLYPLVEQAISTLSEEKRARLKVLGEVYVTRDRILVQLFSSSAHRELGITDEHMPQLRDLEEYYYRQGIWWLDNRAQGLSVGERRTKLISEYQRSWIIAGIELGEVIIGKEKMLTARRTVYRQLAGFGDATLLTRVELQRELDLTVPQIESINKLFFENLKATVQDKTGRASKAVFLDAIALLSERQREKLLEFVTADDFGK